MKAAIFDLDDTLVRNKSGEEVPVKGVRNLLHLAEASNHLESIVLTARTEEVREETINLMDRLDIKYDRFYMRPDSDISKPDDVFKRNVLEDLRDEGISVEFAVEDKKSVAEMWQRQGVECLKMPEKHHLRHELTDILRKFFPYTPEFIRKTYLDQYRKHFER
ncbi:MAG: hypothetical protein ABEK10_02000 [Candidatus Nanosalina sp.]